jgi:hypothetical protein
MTLPHMQCTVPSFDAPMLSAFGSLATPPVRCAPTALRPLQRGRTTTCLQYIAFTVVVLRFARFASAERRP